MKLIQSLRRHPLLGYFLLAFTISWGGILGVLADRRFDLSPMQPLEGGLILASILLARCSVPIAGLSLGVVWAFWHLLVDFRYNADSMGAAWIFEFAIAYLATLTPYRMLMTWVYSHTQSLLLAILMHASFTGWLLVLFPAASFTQGLYWQSAFALALWAVVAVVLSKSPIRSNASVRQLSSRADIGQVA